MRNIMDEIDTDVDEPEVKVKGDESEPFWERIIKADSPDKPLSDYRNHALNWDGKESTSRIIKGFEGIIGNLDKAVVDVAIGTIQKIMELFKKVE